MSILESPQIHAGHRFMSGASPDAEGANFRLAMREFASGVTIIACGEGEARAGCTATAVASLSVSPPSLIVCLSLAASTLQSLRGWAPFRSTCSAPNTSELAERFAGRGGFKGAGRFDLGDWVPLVTGAPVLADALAAHGLRGRGHRRAPHPRHRDRRRAGRAHERREIRAAALAQPVRDAVTNASAPSAPASAAKTAPRLARLAARAGVTARATRDPARILPRAVGEWARRYGDAPALIGESESFSYRALERA